MPDSKINKSEVIRYIGYKESSPDEDSLGLINELISLAEKALSPRAIHGIFEIDDNIICGSKDISAHLKDAQNYILFAATLGAEAEMQLNLFQKSDMQKAVIFDAVCDAYIERFCDEYCKNLAYQLKEKNLYINNRYSPGYGDFKIEKQKEIVAALQCSKLIGLTLTDSYTLLPRKSVTAVIGVFDRLPTGTSRGCSSCNMQNKCKMRGTDKCLKQTDFI